MCPNLIVGVAPGGAGQGQGALLQDDQGDEVADVLDRLHVGGWNVGGTTFFDIEDGGPVWVVTGTNGENTIRAEGATCAEVWRHPLDRASADGILPGWPRPAPAALPIK
ncbi:MAG: hypothetical protein JO034_02280 [Singulisphaera sp.]|nr:hypothetical protein [Singulisphaera sp.]